MNFSISASELLFVLHSLEVVHITQYLMHFLTGWHVVVWWQVQIDVVVAGSVKWPSVSAVLITV